MTAPSSPPSPATGASGGRRDWRAVAAAALLGTTVGGAAINILSASHGWRFLSLAAASGMALLVPVWLGRYPARSGLVTWATRLLLAGAIAAAATAVFGPAGLATPATIAAVLLATAAVLIPTAPHDRLNMMSGIAGIALAVAVAGAGVTVLIGNAHLGGVAFIVCGVAAAGAGVTMLLDNGAGRRARRWWGRLTADPATRTAAQPRDK